MHRYWDRVKTPRAGALHGTAGTAHQEATVKITGSRFGAQLAMLAGVALVLLTGFSTAALAASTVNVGSPSGVLNIANPDSISVPVEISRASGTPAVMAFSVTFSVSSPLVLPSGKSSIALGGFLDADGGRSVSFQTIDKGAGVYQVDGTTLGSPCGSSAPSGTLFNIRVGSSFAACSGTITIQSVKLRDCTNAIITPTIGTSATVISDNAAPTITAPVAVTVSTDAGLCTASGVVLGTPTFGDNCPGATVANNATPPFAKGNTTVTWTVTDGAGNTATATQLVTVNDTENPVIAGLPSNMTVNTGPGATSCNAVASWTVPTASDNCPGVVLTFDHASGSTFPAGTTLVTYTATDVAGNVASGSFTVTVVDNTVPTATLIAPTGGGQLWFVGTMESINWTASDNCGVASIDLDYSTDGGATYPNSIAAGIANSPPYSWLIPNTPTAQARVRVRARDGSGNVITSASSADFTIAGVAAVASLAAQAVVGGNGTGGTTKIELTWTATQPGTSVEIYRRGFGNYPWYGSGSTPGGAPAQPTSYPPSGWTLATTIADGSTTTQYVDQVAWPARDYYYFVAYAVADAVASAPSTMTTGTLNYHLGDVSGGTTGLGDNSVATLDISALGGHYGATLGTDDPFGYLDVGPTTNGFVLGRPLTDGKVEFEDLVMFAINYGVESAMIAPLAARSGTAVTDTPDELVLEAPERVGAGMTVTVGLNLRASGALRALSTKLSWDPAVVEPVEHVAGDWLTQQNGFVFIPAPGTVDAAVFQTGGMTGAGRLATVTFRVLAAGDPKFAVASADARDAGNQKVTVASTIAVQAPVVPLVTEMSFARPNPFSQTATLSFSLARSGPVELAIYSVGGRRVRTLARDVREPGNYELVWDGRDDGGSAVPSGVYYAHLVTAQGRFHRALTYLK